MKIQYRPLLAVAGLTLTATLTGCGSSSSSAPSTSTSGSPSASPSTSASAAISSGTTSVTGGSNAKLDLVVGGFNSKSGQLMSMFKGMYTSIKATADYPSTLVLTYTFAKRVDPKTAGAALATQNEVLQAVCRANFYKAMAAVGVSSPHARFVYANPDGSTVGTYTCK